MIKIIPSILSADFARLGEQVKAVEQAGVERIQVDVMDGRFVPNITFGPRVIECLRPLTKLAIEAHLMVDRPEDFVGAFARAGADMIIVHQEATPHLHRVVQHIRATGKAPGVAINPATPASAISEILPDVDLVLVMTVNPGFGGQHFIPETLAKIRQVRTMLRERNLSRDIEVDGGIHEGTVRNVVEAGANFLVAGSSIYGDKAGVASAIRRLIEKAGAEPE
ncbi:MAG: ribulose-phosphate 3-epimerase [Acidobacteria bacterium]|nr:ribulose-phosphate 3-epimerase [Acidobacteriota bacterium]